MLREITASIPPLIADRRVSIDFDLAANLEAAMGQIVALDLSHGPDLEALAVLLLRTESVASSKIEEIDASSDDYARALHGVRSNSSAISMVAATTALTSMISNVTRRGRIELVDITSAHRALMRDEPGETRYAGRLRTVQNWIGGSDYSPRGALYVPPPPSAVKPLMDDLIAFANRDDLPVLVQAAIGHAQFESIHPFTDGNGRIGRALINTVLRRRGATTRVVIPLASSLVAQRDRYFGLLNTYRRGDVVPLISTFAEASRIAASEARVTASHLSEIPDEWRNLLGPVRSGSAVAKLFDVLPAHPILSSESVTALVDAPRSSLFVAIAQLCDAGVLRPLTDRKRDQIWGAGLVLDELNDLSVRIAQASR